MFSQQSTPTIKNILPFITQWGIVVFVLLYVVATLYYPGGSDVSKTSKGFNLLTNYWCDLLSVYAKNGLLNTARPFAIIAMVVLCVSLAVCWYCMPWLAGIKKNTGLLVRYSGVASMVSAAFLSGKHHDLVINIAGALGMIAFVATCITLYLSGKYRLLLLGIFCILLCFLNNYIYYTGWFFAALAIIQKITFIFFLLWFYLMAVLLQRCMQHVKA